MKKIILLNLLTIFISTKCLSQETQEIKFESLTQNEKNFFMALKWLKTNGRLLRNENFGYTYQRKSDRISLFDFTLTEITGYKVDEKNQQKRSGVVQLINVHASWNETRGLHKYFQSFNYQITKNGFFPGTELVPFGGAYLEKIQKDYDGFLLKAIEEWDKNKEQNEQEVEIELKKY